ncbi:FTR1 family iron permease [Carbonactinospora thermoautotrophica]|uniref:FTR1 family iron permease n=1 Tax=Carbonactinospora thermoautotrophica TaxID=1469144 RepID=UPI00082B6874|nr:FTR1 family protein [Carbonactinospora thermoautotrophica]
MLTAFLIMLREGFEAALVVAIIYAYIRKIGRDDLLRPMWGGVLAAGALSVGVGVVIHLTVESLEGAARLRAFAAISVFAVVVLTWMIFWMRRHARAIKGELQHSIDVAVHARGGIWWAVAVAAFFAVVREGLEAALFLIAAATAESGPQVLTGGLIGLAIAGLLGYLVVLGGKRMPMRQFFTVTGVMLILFAAGLLSRTVMFLQSAGDLGILYNNVYDLTRYEWLTTRSEVGKFLGAMFGWDPRPSIEQVVAYLGYALGVGYLFLRPPRAKQPERPATVPSVVQEKLSEAS